jgi:hypothetical protein
MPRQSALAITVVLSLLVGQSLAGWGTVCSTPSLDCQAQEACCCQQPSAGHASSCGMPCCQKDPLTAAPSMTAAEDSTAVVVFTAPGAITIPAALTYMRQAADFPPSWTALTAQPRASRAPPAL